MRAKPGILGVAIGTLVIAVLSATGLGVLLSTSEAAYRLVKTADILFLFYFGWKRWAAPAVLFPDTQTDQSAADFRRSHPVATL